MCLSDLTFGIKELDDARWYTKEQVVAALKAGSSRPDLTPPEDRDTSKLWMPPSYAIANTIVKAWALDGFQFAPDRPEESTGAAKIQTSAINIRPTTVSDDGRRHHHKVLVKMIEPRVGSLDNVYHRAGGGNVQIFEEKLKFKEKARSRVGSLESEPIKLTSIKPPKKKQNINHRPAGGNIKITNKPTHFRARAHSKVGSLENIHHIPGGGYTASSALSDTSSTSPTLPKLHLPSHSPSSHIDTVAAKAYTQMWTYHEPPRRHSAAPSTVSRSAFDVDVESNFSREGLRRKSVAMSKVGSLENIRYRPGPSQKKIFEQKVRFGKVGSKVGSLENITYAPPASDVQIIDVPLKWRAHSKVGSLDNIHHVPAGGHVTIVDEPIIYKSKTDVARAAR
ncbi:hypothetical protein HK097_006371 [Rhizophlyctis rosea]|uniref:Microtubule-associated protein n=1 Tax=Rhizophlyctis rosea TaxID=64517 RepID=A0AAD5SL51_9FUNG|nr:hypothetical protein HK097_006371 [Rhizophlyctis rosea]